MNRFDILKSEDVWNILKSVVICNRHKWSTYHSYNSVRHAIQNGYLGLLKSRLIEQISSDWVSMAIKYEQLDILKWLVEEQNFPIEEVYPTERTTTGMLEYIDSRFPKKLKYDEEDLIERIVLNEMDMVIFLHRKGLRTTAKAIIHAMEESRPCGDEDQTFLTLESLDFLRKQYPKTMVYDVVSVLADGPNDLEYFEKHKIVKTIVKNGFRAHHPHLQNRNVVLTRCLHKIVPLKASDIWNSYYAVLTTDNLHMMKFFWELGYTSDKYPHTYYQSPEVEQEKGWVNTCIRLFWKKNKTLKWLMKQDKFIDHFRSELKGNDKLYLDNFYLNISYQPEEIKFILDNDIDCHVSSVSLFTKKHSRYTLAIFLRLILKKDRLGIENTEQLCYSIHANPNWLLIARYIYHLGDKTKMSKTAFVKAVGRELASKISFDIKGSMKIDETDEFGLCLVSFCYMLTQVVITATLRAWKILRWYYYQFLADHLETNRYYTFLLKTYMAPLKERDDGAITGAELCIIHKQLYPIVVDLLKTKLSNQYIRYVTVQMVRGAIKWRVVDVIGIYSEHGFADDTDFLYIALSMGKVSLVPKLVKSNPQLLAFLKGYLMGPGPTSRSSLIDKLSEQFELDILPAKLFKAKCVDREITASCSEEDDYEYEGEEEDVYEYEGEEEEEEE